MSQKSLYLTALLILIFLLLNLSCCDDCKCPTCPKPEETEEHLFYISPRVGNVIKVLSVEQAKFIDSFFVDSINDALTMAIHVIGNDSLLAATAGTTTYVIDLQSEEVIEVFKRGSVVFSRDSRYYFTMGVRELYTYPEHSLISYQVGGTLPLFSSDSKYLSDVHLTSPENETAGIEIKIYDIYGDSTFIGLHHIPGIIGWFNYISDKHQKIFFGAIGGIGNMAAAADFGADSIRVLKRFFNDYTVDIVPFVSPDQKYLFISNFVSEFWGGVPDEYIYVFDAETEDSVAAIAFEGMNQVGNMIITHDSKYLLARPFNEFKDKTTVCLIDAVNFRVIGVYDCGFLPFSVSTKYGAKNIGV